MNMNVNMNMNVKNAQCLRGAEIAATADFVVFFECGCSAADFARTPLPCRRIWTGTVLYAGAFCSDEVLVVRYNLT
ncbi:hypothetical protein [Aminiphilus sp.]|jgi:hypothetical protein|uniref:hypothetical protein n=1 Tax=Aminiphilus sp. TaxID=1872488 RepID=UPI00260EF0A9|nr:hypothetical protein [Aminiphilus sp.]